MTKEALDMIILLVITLITVGIIVVALLPKFRGVLS